MKILVTGANGFLGSAVVERALGRGHSVRALVRPAADLSGRAWADEPGVEVARGDLRDRRGLEAHLAGIDAVLHLAAVKSGDFYTQFAGTVTGTENLLAAMDRAGVRRLVLVSTFSVYDYLHLRSGAVLDEDSPIERGDPEHRDEYARTKLLQERLAREWAACGAGGLAASGSRGGSGTGGQATSGTRRLTVLRPGVVYGPGNLWTARLGAQLSARRWLLLGAFARLPLTYVEHGAEAIVLAAETDAASGETLNVVDDAPPRQWSYAKRIRALENPRPRLIVVPWTLARLAARSAWLVNRICFRGRARTPGVLSPARLHARCKPLRYSNARIKDRLGWAPWLSLDEALARSGGSAPTRAGEAGGAEAARDDGTRAETAMAGESAA